MKIYDCTTFYSEHMMMDVRFNILDKHVEKFIVTESTFSHSGKKKPLNFDINNYPKFKDKIILTLYYSSIFFLFCFELSSHFYYFYLKNLLK